MQKKYKAAIFDLDGTLLDTIRDLGGAVNWGLSQYGFPTLPMEHHINAVGQGLRNYCAKSIPEEKVTDELLDVFVEKVKQHYNEFCTEETQVYEGIYDLIAYMKEQGISVNILSNKVDAIVEKLASHYFGEGVFDKAYGERENIPRKPDPTAALSLAEELGMAPSEILFIGDSVYDVITGKRAGMCSVAVSWGYQSTDRLKAESPAFIAQTPYDIIEYLKEEKK